MYKTMAYYWLHLNLSYLGHACYKNRNWKWKKFLTTDFTRYTSVVLLFYAVCKLLSVETKTYECFAFAVIYLRNPDTQNGNYSFITLEEANKD